MVRWLLGSMAMLACLLDAGCADPDPARPQADDPLGSPLAESDGLPLPTWAVGDAWTYRFNGEDATYVVTSDAGSDWIVETDSAERSFADLRHDISRLGPQRKSDLAGSQGDDRVEFFRWPLRAGMSWGTRWDGQGVTITTQAAGDLVALEAHDANGTLVYRYSYDPAVGWFRELHHLNPDGSELVGLVLTAAAHNWTGNVVRWSLESVHEAQGSGGVNVAGPFQVAAGTTDIWASYEFTCTGTAGWSVLVQPANQGLAAQQGAFEGGPCSHVESAGVIQEAPQDGEWAFAISAGGETADFDYAILLRTRQDVPVGAG